MLQKSKEQLFRQFVTCHQIWPGFSKYKSRESYIGYNDWDGCYLHRNNNLVWNPYNYLLILENYYKEQGWELT